MKTPPSPRYLTAAALALGCAEIVTGTAAPDVPASPDVTAVKDAARVDDVLDATLDRADDAPLPSVDHLPETSTDAPGDADPHGCIVAGWCSITRLCPPDPSAPAPDPSAPLRPPVIESFVALRGADRTWFSATGIDVNGDADRAEFEALDASGAVVTVPTRDRVVYVHREGIRFRAVGSIRSLEVRAARAVVLDREGMRGEQRRAEVAPQPERREGEPCDYLRAVDRCAADTTCRPVALGGTSRCLPSGPIVVERAELFDNPIDGRARLQLSLRDSDLDTVELSTEVRDASGVRLPAFETFGAVTAAVARRFSFPGAACSMPIWWHLGPNFFDPGGDLRAIPARTLRILMRLRDHEGHTTEVRDFTVRTVVTVGEGEACDANWVERRCDRAAGFVCRDLRCVRASTDCPSNLRPVDLNANPVDSAPETWRFAGRADERIQLVAGPCYIQGDAALQTLRFRAPRSGRWRFALTSEGGIAMNLRASCTGDSPPETHFCAAGRDPLERDYTLSAGEVAYLRVATAPTRPPFTVTVRPAP